MKMTSPTWIHLLPTVYFACMRLACAVSDGSLTCTISYKAWDFPESLKVNWSIPDIPEDHDELDINVTRYMWGNEDNCSEVSLTSCTWNHNLENGMNLNFAFKLFVTIKEKKSNTIFYKKEWEINPDNCKKPPPVDHVTADAINSTCADIRWWYNSKAFCWGPALFKISFIPEHATELTMRSKREDIDLVHVQLRVHKSVALYPGTERDYLIAVMGPTSKPNSLKTETPQRCIPTGFETWTKDIWVPNTALIFFKFAVVKSQSSAIVEKECLHAHRAFIGLKPVIVECTFNKRGIVIKVLERTNRTGSIRKTPRIPKLTGMFSDRRERMAYSVQVNKMEKNEYNTDRKYSRNKVPAGAAEMVRGGFSLVKNECATKNIRAIRLFWKDVPAVKKHGIITHFHMEIIPTSPSELDEQSITKSIDGRVYNSLVSLRCDLKYNIQLRAETSAGVAFVYSSIYIPGLGQDSKDVIDDVIPLISSSSFHVNWTVGRSTSVQKQLVKEYHVFWCLKATENHCVSPINWTTVQNNFTTYVTVPVQKGIAPYKYLLGVSYGDIGIHWANCHYTQLKDIRPPVGLRLESDKTFREGSMEVHWENDPCESRVPGPYIHRFLISFCKVKDRNKNTCTEVLLTHVVSNRRKSYLIGNLDAGAMYRVCVQTVAISSTLSNSSCIYGQSAVHDTFWTPRAIVVSVVVATILFSCAIYGSIKCNTHLHRKIRTFLTERFRITIPENYQELERDNSSTVNEYYTTV